MLYPEATHALVRVRESEPVFGKRMGEEGRVEVHAQAGLAGPIDPACEMLGPDFVAIDPQAAGLGVDCVEVDAVPAGDERDGFLEVRAQLVWRPRPGPG